MNTTTKRTSSSMIHQNGHENDKAFEKMSNVMNASIALLSLCITVISLFQIADKRAAYLADELFAISSALYLTALIASYLHTKGNAVNWLTTGANIVFTTALLCMLVAGIYLVFEL
jgi:hypothetical protein